MDMNIYNVYGEQMQTYFQHYGLDLKIHKTMIGEKAKSMDTLLSIVDSMNDFGIIRKVGICICLCVDLEIDEVFRSPSSSSAVVL